MEKVFNLQTIKASNRSAVLYLLNESGMLSRKQIANALGLTAAAVTKITGNLLDEGSIVEKESVGSGVGRKEILLSIEYGNLKALGISFERDYITFSISSLEGELIEKESVPFDKDFTKVKKLVNDYYFKVKGKYNFLGAGISIIGRENEFGIWPNINIGEEFEKIIDIPVIVRNNVKAFATANVLFNQTRDYKNVLLFKWGPGIGSSFIRDGKVLSGDDQGITEIGHMIVNPHGKECRCGRVGCLETETALDIIKEEVSNIGLNLEIEEILNSNDERVLKILDYKISMVCMALMNAATILDASKILLFGSVFESESFLNMFYKKWNEIAGKVNYVTLGLSDLNDKTCYIGSTAMVKRKLFFEKGI